MNLPFLRIIPIVLVTLAWCTGFQQGSMPPLFDKTLDLFQKDLDLISYLKFTATAPLFQRFFQPSNAIGLQNFIEKRVHKISWEPNAPEGVTAAANGNGILFLTREYADNYPQIARISVIIHEAKHLEPETWDHQWCRQPYLFQLDQLLYRIPELNQVSVKACDRTELGAYGIQYTFLRAIAESCSNCTDKIKMDARLYSVPDGLIRIDDARAAARLIEGANLNPAQAKRDVRQILGE